MLKSEMMWMEALCRDTTLTLPVPQYNREKKYVTQVAEVACTMLTWVQGEQKQYFTNEEDLKSTAQMTAALHRQASAWQPPASLTRPTHDSSRVRHALDLLTQRSRAGAALCAGFHVLPTAGESRSNCSILPRNKRTWGILHMDLFPANIVYVNGQANPIDFGACGYGFFLNDLAATFCFVHPSQREKFIEWYGEHYPLPG